MIIYAICLVLGLMFTLISAFLGHLFGGHESVGAGGHADAGFDSDGVEDFPQDRCPRVGQRWMSYRLGSVGQSVRRHAGVVHDKI